AFGILEERDTGVFSGNGASDLLRDRPGGLRNWALYVTSRYIWDAVGATDHALRTGESAFEHVHGESLWHHLRTHPGDAAVCTAMFGELWGGREHEAIADAYEWSDASTVVDVGGGNASLLATILAANGHLRGAVVDQESVLESAAAHLVERGLRDRC